MALRTGYGQAADAVFPHPRERIEHIFIVAYGDNRFCRNIARCQSRDVESNGDSLDHDVSISNYAKRPRTAGIDDNDAPDMLFPHGLGAITQGGIGRDRYHLMDRKIADCCCRCSHGIPHRKLMRDRARAPKQSGHLSAGRLQKNTLRENP